MQVYGEHTPLQPTRPVLQKARLPLEASHPILRGQVQGLQKDYQRRAESLRQSLERGVQEEVESFNICPKVLDFHKVSKIKLTEIF